ncbi:MAG: polyhydroxyalkanoic acid system family protein [Halioglobus sp.]|nr:polyhydroxyalkanoic acid system family protein [Halioglobus sp.]
MQKEELRRVARELASKIEGEYGLRARWQGDSVTISGRGVNGAMSFGDDEIEVTVKLGMLASLFESRLKQEVERYLDENVT